MNKKYFENLDFLRFVAFFLVFTQHSLLGQTLKTFSTNDFYARCVTLLSSGNKGVSFFFVLSGFLITYLILTEIQEQGKLNLKHFYIRRTLRIWPLFLAVVCFGFFIYPFIKNLLGIHSIISNDISYYFSFLSNFDTIRILHNGLDDTAPMMLNITWSVSIEEQFYLFWPLIFIVLPQRLYVYTFYVIILCSLVFRYIYINDLSQLYFHTFGVMGDLSLGGLFAYYSIKSNRFLSTITNLPKLAVIGIYIFGFSLLLYGNYFYPTKFDLVYLRLIYTLFFGFIILEQNFARNSFVKFGRFKAVSRLGKYTYGLYLLHPIGIQASIIIYNKFNISQDQLVFALGYSLVAFIISMVISYLSYHYFEAYFLKIKKRYSGLK